jgi:alkaline phosphatase D
MSDIHYGAHNKSEEGQDTGLEFLNITLKKMKRLESQVDFILNLGDMPTHLVPASKKKVYERTLFHRLYQANTAKKPMFYIPGNNDSLAGNYQPFSVDGVSPLTYAKEWDGSCVYCKDLMIDKTRMHRGGYYSSYVIPQNKELLLIALNSAPFVDIPFFASKYPNQEGDADAELTWLSRQLQAHPAKQVLIAMHVPPGLDYKGKMFWLPQYQERFIAILERHAASFGEITLLSGHAHMDEVRKISLEHGRVIYNYSTPGISRNHNNNPAMKIVSLDKHLAVKNFTTYYTSHLDRWEEEQYQAQDSAEAIFPQCSGRSLAQCLNRLSDEEVCMAWDVGSIYGVKNKRVSNGVCERIYRVNA